MYRQGQFAHVIVELTDLNLIRVMKKWRRTPFWRVLHTDENKISESVACILRNAMHRIHRGECITSVCVGNNNDYH